MTKDFRREHVPQKRGKGEAPRAKPAKNRKTRAKMAGKRTNAAGMKIEIPDTTPVHTDYLQFALEEKVITQALLDSV